MKGVIHFHSNHSYDSNFSVEKIIDKSVEKGLGFLILCDHDTVNGSIELRNTLKKRGHDIIVPIAAEYKTEVGDLIAAFIYEEITDMSLDGFITSVHKQGGIVLFPHPSCHHKIQFIDKICRKVNIIEVFNSRCSLEDDIFALNKSKQFNIPSYVGSDAHLSREFNSVIVEYDSVVDENSLKKSLLSGSYKVVSSEKTTRKNICRSQLIKSLKYYKFLSVLKNIICIIKKRKL